MVRHRIGAGCGTPTIFLTGICIGISIAPIINWCLYQTQSGYDGARAPPCSRSSIIAPLDAVNQREDNVLVGWVRDVIANKLPTVRPISRWWHYLPLFQRHFGRWFNATEPVHVLEVGLGGGG
jgi:hypothetical protein